MAMLLARCGKLVNPVVGALEPAIHIAQQDTAGVRCECLQDSCLFRISRCAPRHVRATLLSPAAAFERDFKVSSPGDWLLSSPKSRMLRQSTKVSRVPVSCARVSPVS